MSSNGGDTVAPRRVGGPVAGVKLATGTVEVGDAWKKVRLDRAIPNPVVLVGPATYNDPDPGAVRVKDVSEWGFRVRFAEWDYLYERDRHRRHAPEQIPYLVIEAGRHAMSDGSAWVAGTFQHDGADSFGGANFAVSFPDTPKMFVTAQTAVGPEVITVRATGTLSGIRAKLFEQEASDNDHVLETIGYLAIFQPANKGRIYVNGVSMPYWLDSANIDIEWQAFSFADLRLQEEQSRDDELGHPKEAVDILTLCCQTFAQDIGIRDVDTITIRQR